MRLFSKRKGMLQGKPVVGSATRRFSLLHVLILILFVSAYAAAAAETPVNRSSIDLRQVDTTLGAGWILADLDHDGKPDIASGHRVSHNADGYLYQIELRLSTEDRRRTGLVTLSHTDALGLQISAIDIDGDKDLDLVIGGRFTATHSNVFLNDGNGRFVESPADRFSPFISQAGLASLTTGAFSASRAAVVQPHRRLLAGLPEFSHSPSLLVHDFEFDQSSEFSTRSIVDANRLRAPPSTTL
jgi:hypothetical protein